MQYIHYLMVNIQFIIMRTMLIEIFSIAHEVAHHLLEHCSDGVREHHDANLLAAIIVTPNISSNKIKSATVLSENYLIPYSVACEYFAELKDEQRTNKNHLRHWLFSIIP